MGGGSAAGAVRDGEAAGPAAAGVDAERLQHPQSTHRGERRLRGQQAPPLTHTLPQVTRTPARMARAAPRAAAARLTRHTAG